MSIPWGSCVPFAHPATRSRAAAAILTAPVPEPNAQSPTQGHCCPEGTRSRDLQEPQPWPGSPQSAGKFIVFLVLSELINMLLKLWSLNPKHMTFEPSLSPNTKTHNESSLSLK